MSEFFLVVIICMFAGDAINNSTSAPTVMTFTSAARGTAAGGVIVEYLRTIT